MVQTPESRAAFASVERARNRGVSISPNGEKLRIKPPPEMPDSEWGPIRADLARHKAAILELLSRPPGPPPPPWSELASIRWGPALDDDLPGLDVGRDRPIRPLLDARP